MRRGRIIYSAEEMAWLEANSTLVIGDYAAGFHAKFGREDVAADNLNGLRKRMGWKTGPRKGRTFSLKFGKAELAWLRDNCTLPIGEYHRGFCEAFGRDDLKAVHLNALRKRKGWRTGRDGHFNKGAIPWIKGRKLPFNAASAVTQFKKGHRGGIAVEIYQPIGTEMVREGYVVRKIHDGMPMQSRWRAVHILNWEAKNGPLPDGMCLKCLDGDKLNTDLSNWDLISRGTLATLALQKRWKGIDYERAEPELRPAILTMAKITNKARMRARAEA